MKFEVSYKQSWVAAFCLKKNKSRIFVFENVVYCF